MADVFKTAALKVGTNYRAVSGDAEAFISPTEILAWMEILKSVVEMLQDCRKAKDVPAMSANPGPLERRLLKHKVRQVLGLREFRRIGDNTVDAILKTGQNATEQEVQELYDAV
jgi:hypothetical protein